MAHHGSGVVLKTVFDKKRNRVLRTVFDKRVIQHQTITNYIPPLFMMINYEETALTRTCYYKTIIESPPLSANSATAGKNTGHDMTVKTDEVIEENVRFIKALLISGDCECDTLLFTFLRLEVVGDFQRNFKKLYPLWNVGIGALARLTFPSWAKRARALRLLATNAANNQDIFTINYAANRTTVTVIDYMEPLFAYCTKMEDRNNTVPTAAKSTTQRTRRRGKSSSSSTPSIACTSEIFEIDFCVIDEPLDEKDDIDGHSGRSRTGASTDSLNLPNTGGCNDSLRDVSSRGTQRICDGGIDGRRKEDKQSRRPDALLLTDKPRAMSGPLTAHDVRPFFSMLKARRIARTSLDQLDDLPVVAVRCERHFCVTTCCVRVRTKKVLTVMHVYYCWDAKVHRALSKFADYCNSRPFQDFNVMVAVSGLSSENVESRLKMLEDLRNVIWKDNVNAYLRLAVDDVHDQEMLARNFNEPLVFQTQRTNADLETEMKIAVDSSLTAGSVDIFRNAITLDCARLCVVLDGKTCQFAKTHRSLLNDASLLPNGHIRMDRYSTGGRHEFRDLCRQLEHKQNLYARLVTEFSSERLLENAIDMASELCLGLLDVFGLVYTDQVVTPQNYHYQNNASGGLRAMEDTVLDSLRVSNCVFIQTLLGCSVYLGNSGSAAACGTFFDKEKNAKPMRQCKSGLYKSDIIEFDLKSAYPSVAVLYNISPETTAIVDRNELKHLDQALDLFVNDASHLLNPVETVRIGPPQHSQRQQNNVMASIYTQIGHVNDFSSSLVVVSLKPEIYVGVLTRFMEMVVLKRMNSNQVLNTFYKRLANVVYGCTGRSTPFNDLFSPQCSSAIRSLCNSVMTRTLMSIPPESLVSVQTDGALLYAGLRDDGDNLNSFTTGSTTQEFERSVQASLDAVVKDVGNATSAIHPMLRFRSVDMCLVVDQNQQLILYTDGQTVCKGQQSLLTRGVGYDPLSGECLIENLMAAISSYVHKRFGNTENVAVELNRFLDFCFDHMAAYASRIEVDWFFTTRLPTANHSVLSEKSQKEMTGFSLNEYGRKVNSETVARFGDTVSVWPVVVFSEGEVFKEFRNARPLTNKAVQANYVYVVSPILLHWTKCLFRVHYPRFEMSKVLTMFAANSYRHERSVGNVLV